MSAHTPGPWMAEQFGREFNVWPISRAKPKGTAVAYRCDEADAHLIAAAPELLESLRAVLKSLEDDKPIGITERSEAWAAIVKATGVAK